MKDDFEHIIFSISDRVAVCTLNRPEVLNAMNRKIWKELREVFDKAPEYADALILTGSGRAFSSGADLKESASRSAQQYEEYLELVQEVSKKLISLPMPTIAAINGYALGAGFELALACDIRTASKEAKVGFPEAAVASAVTGGGYLLLSSIVGQGIARELLFTSEHIPAETAHRYGLINHIYPASDLLEETKKIAKKIVANSLESIRIIKEGLNRAIFGDMLDSMMRYEVDSCICAVSTEERKEKIKGY